MINISACECNEDGSNGLSCDDGTGLCTCKDNVIGDKCTQCAAGYWNFPSCEGKQKYSNWH